MDPSHLPILVPLFLIVGVLYASVGHAGASGYLAVMALVGVEATLMRPTALAINILVASIALAQFARAGFFSWRLLWPFAALSIPAAYFGAMIKVGPGTLRVSIGIVLLASALRMVWVAWRPASEVITPQAPAIGVGLACGAMIGFVAGLTGTGGGIFLSPLLLIFNWADTKRTAAIAPAFILVNSIAALTALSQEGWQPTPAIGVLALAACVGGFIGAHFGSRRLGHRGLRVVLALVLALESAKLILS